MIALGRSGLLLAFLVFFLASGCALPLREDPTPPEPPQTHTNANTRALLLNPGAIQLGPGLGKNAYRWMGDGQWGF